MQASINTHSFGSMATVPICHRQDCQFMGRLTTESPVKRQTEKDSSLNETPSLKDRLIYPLLAAKSRILDMAGMGASAGYHLLVLPASGIFGLVGCFIGNTIGNLIKYLFFPNYDDSPGKFGTGIGCYAGAWLAVPCGIVLAVVAAAASAVIGLASNIFTLPVDIYRAITLDNKADMKPEPLLGMKQWNDIELPDLNNILNLL